MRYEERLEEHKRKIQENIEYGEKMGINKISAILMINDEENEKIEKDIVSWLIMDGYKVSMYKDDVKVLTIEW